MTAGAQSLRLSAIHHFHANRVRRPAIFGSGVPKKRNELETVGDFHHGRASRLRRPAIFVTAAALEPETVGNFQHGHIMGMQAA